jgi:hypothetical protein
VSANITRNVHELHYSFANFKLAEYLETVLRSSGATPLLASEAAAREAAFTPDPFERDESGNRSEFDRYLESATAAMAALVRVDDSAQQRNWETDN